MYIFVHSPDAHKRQNETLNFLATDNNHLSPELTLKITTHLQESGYTMSQKKLPQLSLKMCTITKATYCMILTIKRALKKGLLQQF